MISLINMIRLPLFILTLLLVMLVIHQPYSYAQGERPLKDPIVIQVIELDYADAEHLASISGSAIVNGGPLGAL